MTMEHGLGIEGLRDESIVGSGGFGTVYRAWDETFNRWVAIKVIHGADGRGLRRFARELAIMGQVSDHENVITPFRAGVTKSDSPYVVMEYVSGGSLSDALADRGYFRWRDAVAQLVPICDALAYAHSRGIMHRDVKPANILLAGEVPKLTDFGIAAIAQSAGSHSTGSQTAFSLAYSPPETFVDGRDQRDQRADVYSVAATIYTLITGRCPYQVDGADSPSAQIVRISDHPIPRIGVGPDELRWLLFRSLAKNPDDRPGSMIELARTLRRLAGGPIVGSEETVTMGPNASQPHRREASVADGLVDDAGAARANGQVRADEANGNAQVNGNGNGNGSNATMIDRRPRSTHADHRDAVLALTVIGDGRVASASADGTVHLWHPADRSVVPAVIDGRCDTVWAVAALGERRVICAADSRVRVIDGGDLGAKPVVFRHDRGPVLAVAATVDHRVVSAGGDGAIVVWEPASPYRHQVRFTGHRGSVWALVGLDDGRIVSAGDDGQVRIWDPERPGDTPVVLGEHRAAVRALVVLADGRLASGGSDGTVRIWHPGRVDDPPVVFDEDDDIRALAALPDGRLVSGGAEGIVRVRDRARPQQGPTVIGSPADPITALAVVPDGRIAVAGDDGAVRLLDRFGRRPSRQPR